MDRRIENMVFRRDTKTCDFDHSLPDILQDLCGSHREREITIHCGKPPCTDCARFLPAPGKLLIRSGSTDRRKMAC